MKTISHFKKILLAVILLVILFGASSFIIIKIHHDRREQSESMNKMYVCSMEPQIIRDKPGKCPICGMALIEKKVLKGNWVITGTDYNIQASKLNGSSMQLISAGKY
jgi:membrane fusion protein, copper/silver efflux system